MWRTVTSTVQHQTVWHWMAWRYSMAMCAGRTFTMQTGACTSRVGVGLCFEGSFTAAVWYVPVPLGFACHALPDVVASAQLQRDGHVSAVNDPTVFTAKRQQPPIQVRVL
jgi:hypothetical protein